MTPTRTAIGALCIATALLGLPSLVEAQDDHDHHDDHTPPAAAARPEHGTPEDHGAHDDHDADDDQVAHDDHADEVRLSDEAVALYGITTRRAERRRLNGTSTVPARVSYNAEAMAHVGTQVQGRILHLAAKLGDEVEEGDVLLVVDSPELGTAQSEYLQETAAVEAAAIGVEAARGLAEVARSTYERAERLRESNGISMTDFLERQGALRLAEAEVRVADANLKVADAARQAAENQLHIFGLSQAQVETLLETGEVTTRYEVRAPLAGRVVEREVTPGEIVGPDREALIVVANLASLWVLADVPEAHVSRVRVGSEARVTMRALDGESFRGTVAYIAPHLDARTRSASVRIVVAAEAGDAPGAHLRPGMFGQAEIDLAAQPGSEDLEVVVVGEAAVLTVEGSPAVFVPVADEPNTFAKRSVKIGAKVGGMVPVISGLEAGESYVATNPFILKAELGKAGAEHVH